MRPVHKKLQKSATGRIFQVGENQKNKKRAKISLEKILEKHGKPSNTGIPNVSISVC